MIVMITTGAATFGSAFTRGLYGTTNTTEEDTSEWLNVNSPEIVQLDLR